MSQALIYVVLECHWNTRLKTEASLSGPFIKWYSRKTIKGETRLPESCLNPRRNHNVMI